MCLAVPGRVLDIEERDGTRMAHVDFGGVVKDVCLEYVPEMNVGDYAIVHVGFALQRLDEESAKQTLRLFENLGVLEEEFGDAWGRAAKEAGAERPRDPGDFGGATEPRAEGSRAGRSGPPAPAAGAPEGAGTSPGGAGAARRQAGPPQEDAR
ncbi:HypC/HybG/HupF family hydrogenase formation chaperone [Streptomyces sp. NPDC002018]|uniref:HypC/HybG/HupF family hydrogenase formation chaperone n=1 Tax=Streptomyces sp. NPDC002018 TaxID=3364629 RepID=UPI0036B80E7A